MTSIYSGSITWEDRFLIEDAIHRYRPYRNGMKYYVGEYIVNRLKNVIRDPELLGPKRILTSDVFYDLRKPLGEAGIDVLSPDAIIKKRRRSKIQNEYILEICRDLGIRRRHAGIITGDTGYLYFRGKRYTVSLDELDKLKTKGVAVVIIEKQGIAEKLSYKSADYGISLLSTRGFLTENALDLSDLAVVNGAKNVSLTDNDISGQIIAVNAPYKRIGINFATLDYFGIRNKIDGLEEVYIPNAKHLKHIYSYRRRKFGNLSDDDLTYLKDKRIEIHAVLNYVGVDSFWDWILKELKDMSPSWDYNRAVKIPKPYQFRSDSTWRVTQLYDNRVATITKPLEDSKKLELSNHDGFIENVGKYESDLRDEFQEAIDNDATTDMSEYDRDLNEFVEKYDNGEYEEYRDEADED
jgi:hypothetical protein